MGRTSRLLERMITNMHHNETHGQFPLTRLRRLRQADWSRRLVAETKLGVNDLIWGIILKDGRGLREPIEAMPGIFRLSPDEAVKEAKRAHQLGIPALALFPYTGTKERSADAKQALNPDNLMCKTASMIRDKVPEIGLMGDVALDPYTDHGQDGLMENGVILNDQTTDILIQQAIIQAKAGFQIVAPSDMMDGRIGAIRKALEGENLIDTMIMAYAAKYASKFYGPYREAIGSAGVLTGDKATYQMDPQNSAEAITEIALDLSEGADMVMVKPGMPYLDILTRARQTFDRPTFAFQVSGEYAMIMAAAANGWLDGHGAMMEALAGFKRAGADGIITYYADIAAQSLA